MFGHDDETGLGVLAALLRARGWSVAVAEIASGGLIGARLAADGDVPFAGATTWADNQDVSALALARGAVETFRADVGIGVGHVEDGGDGGSATSLTVAVMTPQTERVRTVRVLGDRERARTHAASSAIHTARLAVAGTPEG